MNENDTLSPGKMIAQQTIDDFTPSFESFAAYIIDFFYEEVFKGSIRPRQVLDVTGDSPFPGEQLKLLLRRLGFDEYVAPDGNLWEDNKVYSSTTYPEPPLFVIVGRENFDKNILQMALSDWFEEGITNTKFLSQEDFINFWFFGTQPHYAPNDPRIENHPGLKFLASFSEYSWPWPSTAAFPNTGNLEYINFDPEHILKSKYGYTVAKKPGFNDKERQAILDKAVRENVLSFQEIVEHIARLVRSRKLFQKNNPRSNYELAISKWETDLDYLKKAYYQKQFKWPVTRS